MMILAEKIARLRKQNSWSQEDLAEKLDISRQSVSKWESGASIPDLDKIIKMSGIFGVSTDYLLKDELEEEDTPLYMGDVFDKQEEKGMRSVSLEEANTFMDVTRRVSKSIALSVFVLILSPACLIFLGGLSERPNSFITDDMAGGIGVTILLIMVASAVAVLIFKGMELSKYEYFEKERFVLQYGIEGIVRKKKEEFETSYRKSTAAGVSLAILGVVPLMLAAAFSAGEMALVCCVDLLLLMVACAVYIFIRSGSIYGSYQKLLEEGEYTPEKKAVSKKTAPIAGAYWCIVTAVFLGVSFYTDRWDLTIFIWPVAGVLFGAICVILGAVVGGRSRK